MTAATIRRRSAQAVLCVFVMWCAAPAVAGDLKLTVFGGAVASGEFFKATSDGSRAWQTPGGVPLEGIELKAEVDEQAIGGVRLAYGLSPRAALVASLGVTKLDVTGQHRSAATNQVQLAEYDKFTLLIPEVDVRLDLAATVNTVYVLGGLGAAILSFDDSDLLDQTRLFLTLGAGYRFILMEGLVLELELRDALFSKGLDDEQARLNPDGFEESSPQHVVQGSVGWVIEF